jgi:hypothetical protein
MILTRVVSFLQLGAWLSIVGTSISREYCNYARIAWEKALKESSLFKMMSLQNLMGWVAMSSFIIGQILGLCGTAGVHVVGLYCSIMLRLFILLGVLWFHHVHPTLCFGSQWPCMIFGNWIRSWFIRLNFLKWPKTTQCALTSHMNLFGLLIDPWL